uniref:Uncharacterized protein n=1 Tax=Anguilla anguilla TaxID=7936 RepID=A0A0E9XJ11_ANGAN
MYVHYELSIRSKFVCISRSSFKLQTSLHILRVKPFITAYLALVRNAL